MLALIASFSRSILHYTFLPVLLSFRILSICLCSGGKKDEERLDGVEGVESESLGMQLKQMKDSIVKEIRLVGTPSPDKGASPRYRPSNVADDNENQQDPDAVLLLQAAKTISWVEKVYFMQAVHLFCIGIFKMSTDMKSHNLDYFKAFGNLLMWHQGLYAVVTLLTVAFRNDYPFNLTVVLLSMYYCGWIHGVKEAC